MSAKTIEAARIAGALKYMDADSDADYVAGSARVISLADRRPHHDHHRANG